VGGSISNEHFSLSQPVEERETMRPIVRDDASLGMLARQNL